MSTVVERKALTVAQRTAEALKQAGEFLTLDDSKRLQAALLEAAAVGVQRNSAFAAHVRGLYEAMAPRRAPAVAKRTKPATPDIHIEPVKPEIGYRFDPTAPPDPYFLAEFYGSHQLRLALERYTVAPLREAVRPVKVANPRTKPSGTSRQALINYIVEHVAGPGY